MKLLAALPLLAFVSPAAAKPQTLPPQDIIIILDTTGSTGAVLPTWKANMKVNLAFNLNNSAPGSRFAIAKHEDFPFSSYGAPTDVPYKLIVPLTPYADWDSVIQPALDGITPGFGSDGPESQYVALTLALKGGGMNLNGDGDFTDPGEVDPANNVMGFNPANNRIVFLFTTPDLCHNSDTNFDYPQAGTPNANTPGKLEAESLYTAPNITFYLLKQEPLDSGGGQAQRDQAAEGDPTAVSGGMAQLAAASGGLSLGVGVNLENLKEAVVKVLSNEGTCPAFVTTRTGPGNSNNYLGAPMRIGQNWTGQILTVGQPPNQSWIAFGLAPLSLPVPGLGTLLIGNSSFAGPSLLGPKQGPFALHSLTVPNNPALCGITVYSQGAVLQIATSIVTLTNAQDLLIGTIPVL